MFNNDFGKNTIWSKLTIKNDGELWKMVSMAFAVDIKSLQRMVTNHVVA